MRIQPRQQLLEIWKATARTSFQDGKWQWGGRESSNSITDAEQLLCLMLPASGVDSFKVDNPNQTDEEVLGTLRPIGNAAGVPRELVRVLADYLQRYASEDGTPLFHGGSYFGTVEPGDKPTTDQREQDVVESYAISVTLTLATISFARNFRAWVTRPELLADIAELERLASRRLTAAMTGLLRSFTINTFDKDSDEGRQFLRTVNQGHLPDSRFVAEFRRELDDVTAGLRDITMGSGQDKELDSPSLLYECGWSWGLIQSAPKIDFVPEGEFRQRTDGYAEDAPYLYFTVVTLDSLTELFSERIQSQGLLDLLQQQLASRLNFRWTHTSKYWATIASFHERRWPLEDIPWRTTDGFESDYFSLLVSSIAAQKLAERRGTDVDLARLGTVLVELSQRARVTRRVTGADPAVGLHHPGVSLSLVGSEIAGGPQLAYAASDFAPLLLKRSVRVAELINNIAMRAPLLDLADDVWEHTLKRRHRDSSGLDRWHNLWDQPANALEGLTELFDQPSWHHTIRVVESLVFAARLAASRPLPAADVGSLATSLLSEAEHLYDQEQIAGSTEAGSPLRAEMQQIRSTLSRARQNLQARPASAMALLLDALSRLDQLAAARQDVAGVS